MHRRDYCIAKGNRNDGIKDLAVKIKSIAKELIAKFRSYPKGMKIAIVLSDIITLISGIVAAKTTSEIKVRVKNLKEDIKKVEKIIPDALSERINGLDERFGELAQQSESELIKERMIERLKKESGIDELKTIRMIGLINAFISLIIRLHIR